MTLQQFLDDIQQQLEKAGVPTARLDCLVLLEHVLGENRAHLLAYPELELQEAQLLEVQKLVNQRARHEPLSYVIGKTEFYGREFIVTPAVLEPRPESETMIDVIKMLASEKYPRTPQNIGIETGDAIGFGNGKTDRTEIRSNSNWRIVDVGTGSGALGISAALEIVGSQVVLVDIDEVALNVARQNCQRFELDIACVVDDLLVRAHKRGVAFDVVLANLPYVPNDYQINMAATHEPPLAIFGGPDGLDLYRRMFKQLQRLENLKPSYVLTESLPFQHTALAAIAEDHGYIHELVDDFIQLFRRQ